MIIEGKGSGRFEYEPKKKTANETKVQTPPQETKDK